MQNKCEAGEGHEKKATNGYRSVTGARLHSLVECMGHSWAREGNRKTHDQPILERAKASYSMLCHILPCIFGNIECLKAAAHFPHKILTQF